MPSGGCEVTPGYNLSPGERVNNAKLNQGFQPVVRVEEGAITERELEASLGGQFSTIRGHNLLCNGDFSYWPQEEVGNYSPFTGVVTGGRKNDFGGVARWVTANDANRTLTKSTFPPGDVSVPDSLFYWLRWDQTAPIASTNPIPYLGQRLENVRLCAGRSFTFSIWVFATGALTVTPEARQFFGVHPSGPTPSDPVIVSGTPVTLAPNVWTEVKSTFQLPNVSGKTISDLYSATANFPSFTEFRLRVPTGITFTMGFTHAMLLAGDTMTAWDDRSPSIDYVIAQRYYQVVAFFWSSNLAQYTPFVNLTIPMLSDPAGLILSPVISSGSGGQVAAMALHKHSLVQSVANSVNSTGFVWLDGELHSPD